MRSPPSPLHVTPITLSRHGFLKKLFHTVRHAAKNDYSATDMLAMNMEMTTTAMTMTTTTNTTTAITMIMFSRKMCLYSVYVCYVGSQE